MTLGHFSKLFYLIVNKEKLHESFTANIFRCDVLSLKKIAEPEKLRLGKLNNLQTATCKLFKMEK